MRIALITPGFSAHAGHWAIPALEVYATRLARRHEVHVFSLRYPPPGTYAFGGLAHTAIGGGQRGGAASLRIMGRAAAAVRRAHQRQPFDVLHAFWADEAGFVAAWVGRWLKMPALISCAGGELVWFPAHGYGTQGSLFRRWLVRTALRHATLVTTGSRYQLGLAAAQGIDAHRLRLAPLGMDCAHFQPPTAPPPLPPTLVQAASLTPVKGQATLLAVLADVRRHLPTTRLLLAGDGPLRARLQQQAAEMGLGSCISWQDRVGFTQMPAVFRQAHVYVQTSIHEAQGMAVLEAMACGVPALGTPVGVIPEIAAAPPTDEPAALAAHIVALLADSAHYVYQRARARQLAQTHYDLPVAMQRFQDLYYEATSTKSPIPT